MLDLIILFFLCRHIGNIAQSKGLKPRRWIWRTVLTWLGFEFFGLIAGIMLFGFNQNDMNAIYGLMAFAIACGFGGYLLVKAALEKTPNQLEDDIDNIGS